jgi:hypothetical protein
MDRGLHCNQGIRGAGKDGGPLKYRVTVTWTTIPSLTLIAPLLQIAFAHPVFGSRKISNDDGKRG